MTPTDGLPVVEPPFDADDRPVTRAAGVLLAAGTSSRFGEANKLLANLDGEPLVRRAARTLVAADLHPLVAVVGHEAARVRDALSGLGFAVVENPDYAAGQATSVRIAMKALDGDGVDAAVFALGDMPAVAPETVRALVAAHRAGHGTALAAAHAGERGNPVLFDAVHFPALAGVEGDVGGREILCSGEDSALVETGDPGVRRDVDTRADLAAVRDDR
jgi:molybdenum cofactor cytidylyltransferase